MIILQWCKTQILSLLILGYVGLIYIKDGNKLNKMAGEIKCNTVFDILFVLSELAVLFDGITACTVNFTDFIPYNINIIFHLLMFVLYEFFVIFLFWYWFSETIGKPKTHTLIIFSTPGVIFFLVSLIYIYKTEFLIGSFTNYSMGISVYSCYICIAFYFLMTIIVILSNHRNISQNKKKSLITSLIFIVVILSLQIIFPEFLVSSIAVTMIMISIYITMENPSIKSLEHYHHEMVTGFATLVENRDDNTGGHIRRSSAYAVLIAKNLSIQEKYRNIITKDFLDNLSESAPMHDIGKISVPDSILQKPGRLTNEEFEIMKKHPVDGGKIISETFGHLDNGEYQSMAQEIALYHHEKWNGKGYPLGLSDSQIPLPARIMAVADVFDAVSAKRCYRDALPLEECYSIIKNGRGTDFDPDVVDAFFMDIKLIENIYKINI